MATRSRIGIQLADQSILSVYCHWDGYPEFNALAAHGVLVGAGAGFVITVLRGSPPVLASTLPAHHQKR